MSRPVDVTIILDRSGSMQSTREATVKGVNDFIRSVNEVPGEGSWTLLQFDDPDSARGAGEEFPHCVFGHVPSARVPLLEPKDFVPLADSLEWNLGQQYLRERGNALWALAEAKALKGDVEGADEAFRQATGLLGEHGHRRDHVEAYRAWGKFLRRAGREEQALEVLERAADLAAEPAVVESRGRR